MILESTLTCVYNTKQKGVRIFPGNNIFTDEVGAKLLEQKDIKQKIEMPKPIFIVTLKKSQKEGDEEITGNEAEKAAKLIASHSVKDAIAVIKDLLEINTLRAILEIDERAGVQNAATKKIKELTDERSE